jgi:hypothetical protein
VVTCPAIAPGFHFLEGVAMVATEVSFDEYVDALIASWYVR